MHKIRISPFVDPIKCFSRWNYKGGSVSRCSRCENTRLYPRWLTIRYRGDLCCCPSAQRKAFLPVHVKLMDSEALKDFSFDKIGASESDEMEIIEMGSLIKLKEVASGGQEVCRRTPSIGSNYYPEGCDGAFIELIDGMDVCPATPSPDSESLDFSCSSDQSEEREAISIAQTPLQNTFDPFAPAKEDLAVAPMKKTLNRMQIPHLRKLEFFEFLDSTHIECHVPEEDHLSELLSQLFFELIVSCQLQEISASRLLDHEQHSKYPNTPVSLPLLTGVAETCPPAPKREPARSIKLDPGVCRQLDFPDDDMAG